MQGPRPLSDHGSPLAPAPAARKGEITQHVSFRRRTIRWLTVAAFAVSIGGCATVGPPVQEMSDVRQSVQAVRALLDQSNGESMHLSAAETLLERASQALAEGRYEAAREAAKAAKEQAIRARRMLGMEGDDT